MNLVQLKNVSHNYGVLSALSNLNLNVTQGEILGLFGHNGAGKTTSMKLIMGLLTPTKGQVNLFGDEPTNPTVRAKLGYLPENVSFYPQLTGYETLSYFARLKSVSDTQVNTLLEQVGLTHACHRKVKTYSKGMRQRLGLAQALLGQPKLLLLDEPTVGLDPIATSELYEIIKSLKQQNCAVILCSHVLSGVENLIDRAVIMANGKVQAQGTLNELRIKANLPNLIQLSALSQPDMWAQKLTQAGFKFSLYHTDYFHVFVDQNEKQQLLTLLTEHSALDQVEIRQANMDEIYRHFIQHQGIKVK